MSSLVDLRQLRRCCCRTKSLKHSHEATCVLEYDRDNHLLPTTVRWNDDIRIGFVGVSMHHRRQNGNLRKCILGLRTSPLPVTPTVSSKLSRIAPSRFLLDTMVRAERPVCSTTNNDQSDRTFSQISMPQFESGKAFARSIRPACVRYAVGYHARKSSNFLSWLAFCRSIIACKDLHSLVDWMATKAKAGHRRDGSRPQPRTEYSDLLQRYAHAQYQQACFGR